MLLENQNPNEENSTKENYQESCSPIKELPAKSLTELEQDYYDIIQTDNSN